MTFESFVEINKDKSLADKLSVLRDQYEYRASDRVHALECTLNGAIKNAEYYHNEIRAIGKRIEWLYNDLYSALKEIDNERCKLGKSLK